jgi:carbonic anhydrase
MRGKNSTRILAAAALVFLPHLSSLAWADMASKVDEPPMQTALEQPVPAQKAPHWGYEGHLAPLNWGNLGFPTCSEGKTQSPIDVARLGAAAASRTLTFEYQSSPIYAVNNGHTVQFKYGNGSLLHVKDATGSTQSYELIQFHLHSHSEHTVSGASFPMELHLVHKAKDGTLAVVGVFLTEAGIGESPKHNETLDRMFGSMPGVAGLDLLATGKSLRAEELLPVNRTFFHYMGSLTTPPCTEGVNWFVMTDPIKVSRHQLARFMTIYNNNFRPVQPLNEREPQMGGSRTTEVHPTGH